MTDIQAVIDAITQGLVIDPTVTVPASQLTTGEVFVDNPSCPPQHGFRVVHPGLVPIVESLAPYAPEAPLPISGQKMVYPALEEVALDITFTTPLDFNPLLPG